MVKYCCLPGKGVQCLGLLVPVVLLIGVPVRLGLIDPAHGVLIHIKVAPDNLVFFVFGIRPDNDYGGRITTMAAGYSAKHAGNAPVGRISEHFHID